MELKDRPSVADDCIEVLQRLPWLSAELRGQWIERVRDSPPVPHGDTAAEANFWLRLQVRLVADMVPLVLQAVAGQHDALAGLRNVVGQPLQEVLDSNVLGPGWRHSLSQVVDMTLALMQAETAMRDGSAGLGDSMAIAMLSAVSAAGKVSASCGNVVTGTEQGDIVAVAIAGRIARVLADCAIARIDDAAA